MLHVDLSFRIRSRPPCHSESASAVPIYAALHFVIPHPLPSTLSFRIRSRPPCHSESASAVPIYAALHFVIPNPLPSTLSFRIRSRPPCHSESALAVRNLLFRLIVSGNAACPVPSHSCD